MILFIKHVEIEGPETFGDFFVGKGYDIRVLNLHRGERLPEGVSGLDAVIPLGGPMNVYEEDLYRFLKEEDLFLKEVLKARVPVLGICLGAQLLAKASGGKVVRSPEKEIGWFMVDLTREGSVDPLFSGIASSLEVYQWHGDMCVPSAESIVLASSAGCPVQAFRYGVNAYGVQFHIEITDQSIKDWSADFSSERQWERKEMLERYSVVRQSFHTRARIVCENFLNIMRAA